MTAVTARSRPLHRPTHFAFRTVFIIGLQSVAPIHPKPPHRDRSATPGAPSVLPAKMASEPAPSTCAASFGSRSSTSRSSRCYQRPRTRSPRCAAAWVSGLGRRSPASPGCVGRYCTRPVPRRSQPPTAKLSVPKLSTARFQQPSPLLPEGSSIPRVGSSHRSIRPRRSSQKRP